MRIGSEKRQNLSRKLGNKAFNVIFGGFVTAVTMAILGAYACILL